MPLAAADIATVRKIARTSCTVKRMDRSEATRRESPRPV